MLELLFGNKTAERVLLYIANYGEGYASGIANTFGMPVNMVQKQLQKLELSGAIVSLQKGKTRVFTWNPRYPFKNELLALLNKALEFVSEAEKKKYYMQRTRPRRSGKPL